jgi:hypothetical protein
MEISQRDPFQYERADCVDHFCDPLLVIVRGSLDTAAATLFTVIDVMAIRIHVVRKHEALNPA